MKKSLSFIVSTLIFVLLFSACSVKSLDTNNEVTPSFDTSDEFKVSDNSIKKSTRTIVLNYLMNNTPKIRVTKSKLSQKNKNVKLTVNIISAPQPKYSKKNPNYLLYRNCYQIYVSYISDKKFLHFDTYLVHKDLNKIFIANPKSKKFSRVKN